MFKVLRAITEGLNTLELYDLIVLAGLLIEVGREFSPQGEQVLLRYLRDEYLKGYCEAFAERVEANVR